MFLSNYGLTFFDNLQLTPYINPLLLQLILKIIETPPPIILIFVVELTSPIQSNVSLFVPIPFFICIQK